MYVESKFKPNMIFDQTILLIVSQICIDTNLEFGIWHYHYIVTGGKVKTKPSCRFRHLKVRELEFQPHLPTFWVHKWSSKSRHRLQWSPSNYFSSAQLKTSPKKSQKLGC